MQVMQGTRGARQAADGVKHLAGVLQSAPSNQTWLRDGYQLGLDEWQVEVAVLGRQRAAVWVAPEPHARVHDGGHAIRVLYAAACGAGDLLIRQCSGPGAVQCWSTAQRQCIREVKLTMQRALHARAGSVAISLSVSDRRLGRSWPYESTMCRACGNMPYLRSSRQRPGRQVSA